MPLQCTPLTRVDRFSSPNEGEGYSCPLCAASSTVFHRDPERMYLRCFRCRLVFVDPSCLPTAEQEREHYARHENDPDDPRYRQFLNRLFEPLQRRLSPQSLGLDFGSGPGPTLSVMFAEAGHETRIYDPFFAPQRDVLSHTYDFVTSSEVVEHFHRPARDLQLMWSLLRVGGWLGIMTKRMEAAESFADWHYKRDPTHVSFFSLETFAWLAMKWRAQYEPIGADVVLFRKMSTAVESFQL